MANKDYYSVLGIDKNLPNDKFQDELRKKYRKLCVQYHPDKHVNDSEADKKAAEEKFKEIAEAYSVLSDPQKKQQYDTFGTVDGNFSGGGGFNPNDIMNEFMRHFGNFGGFGGHTHAENMYNQGEDKKIQIAVTLEDIFFERFKDVTYDVYRPCDECNGRGSLNGRDVRCPYCGGTGNITKTSIMDGAMFQASHPCPHCHGTGYFVEDPCGHCGGTGIVRETVTRGFKIPKIDKLNNIFRMEGEGHSCANNRGTNGDLYFKYVIKEDPNATFHIDRSNPINLCTEIEVDALDCIVGGEKSIKTLRNEIIKIKIPAGTKDGCVLSIYGQGFKCSNGTIGQLKVTVKMAMPKLNDEAIKKIKEIKELNNK